MKKQLFLIFTLFSMAVLPLTSFAKGARMKTTDDGPGKSARRETPVRGEAAKGQTHAPVTQYAPVETNKPADWQSMDKTEKRTWRKDVRQQLKDVRKANQTNGDNLVVGIILAIFLPPVAVWYWEGITTLFWIDLILFVLGIGILWFAYYSGLLVLAAVVIALLVVLDAI